MANNIPKLYLNSLNYLPVTGSWNLIKKVKEVIY